MHHEKNSGNKTLSWQYYTAQSSVTHLNMYGGLGMIVLYSILESNIAKTISCSHYLSY